MADLDKLRKVAAAATPGPWAAPYFVDEDEEPGDGGGWVHNGREGSAEYAVALTLPYSPKVVEDAAFIAAFDPPTVLALLDVADAAWAAAGMYPDSELGNEAHVALSEACIRLREVTSDG